MRREETRVVITCDNCGKEIYGDERQSPETKFSRPDLDGFHGIWMGDVGEYYIGRRDHGEPKEFCGIECLFDDIRKFRASIRRK